MKVSDFIIFENNDFIAINKPSGLLSIPDREGKETSLKKILQEKYARPPARAGTDGDDPRLNDSVGQAVGRGKLWFDSKRSPKLTGELFYYKANTFVVKWKDRSMDADAYLNFSLNEEGKASGLKMRAISPLTDFSYDFHDLDFRKVE